MAYNSAYTGSQVDAAVGAVRQKETIWDGKQDELTGTEDQLVGFNSAGEATAVPKPTAADVGALPTQTGTQGQVLGFTADNTVGAMDAPSGLPTGGTPGQMLYQGESGPEWGDKPVMVVKITQASSGQFVADKTGKEIYEAYQAGNAVIAYWDYVGQGIFMLAPLNSASKDEGVEVYYISFCIFMSSGVVDIVMIDSSDGPYIQMSQVALTSDATHISFTPGTTGLTSDNVQDAIEEVNDKIIESTSTTVTLNASGWTGSAAPFSQQVSCSIVAADTAVVAVDVDTPGTDADADAEAINAWALCTQRNPTQGAGTLTFYCTEKPTINIPVKVGVA